MNRNSYSRFGSNPVDISIERSRFTIPQTHKTTFNNGDLIPIFHMWCLPGDTIELNMAELVRMQTPIFPVMDDMYLDTYFFKVPIRLVWENFERFMGENKQGAWTPTVTHTVPKLVAPSGGWAKGTIADYFGIPTGKRNIDFSSLLTKAYVKIWNDWFRDETRKQPANITMGDTNLTGQNGTESGYTYVTGAEKGGLPLKVARLPGYFENSLPDVQRGPVTFIPVGGVSGTVPIITSNQDKYHNTIAMKFDATSNTSAFADGTKYTLGTAHGTNDRTGEQKLWAVANSPTISSSNATLAPTNLFAKLDLNNTVYSSTINQLREAFAIQRHYEKLRRGGGRYIEIVKEIFGRTSSDRRLQRAEYLGGSRQQIQMESVVQHSSTDSVSPQGNVSGNSKTVFSDRPFITSCTEHCLIIGVQCTRTKHTYQQGINRLDRAYDLFDWYFPSLAHIGEQPIYNWEIYAQGSNVTDTDGNVIDDQVFGYQERWASYRYMPSIVTGEMRSNYATPLDAYHYADYYTSLPIGTSSTWIDEPRTNVDRTLAVGSGTADQMLADIAFKITATRPMPLYSIPGLIDHY